MERLTQRTNGVVVYVGAHNKDAVGQTPFEVSSRGIREILALLAEYEDTGLTPENCAEYRKFEEEIIASGKTFGRLIELLKADKEGRVVVLPCKVGGEVYASVGYPRDVEKYRVVCACINEADELSLIDFISTDGESRRYSIPLDMCGNVIFSTREEAEEALMEAGHDQS